MKGQGAHSMEHDELPEISETRWQNDCKLCNFGVNPIDFCGYVRNKDGTRSFKDEMRQRIPVNEDYIEIAISEHIVERRAAQDPKICYKLVIRAADGGEAKFLLVTSERNSARAIFLTTVHCAKSSPEIDRLDHDVRRIALNYDVEIVAAPRVVAG